MWQKILIIKKRHYRKSRRSSQRIYFILVHLFCRFITEDFFLNNIYRVKRIFLPYNEHLLALWRFLLHIVAHLILV